MAKRRKTKRNNSSSRANRIKSGIKRKINKTGDKVKRAIIRKVAKQMGISLSPRRIQRSAPAVANSRDKQRIKPAFDIGKGRLVYPVKGDNGKTSYLPKESTASKDEIKKGLFIEQGKKDGQEIVKSLERKYDVGKGRFLHPVKDDAGKISYLTRKSEATKVEKGKGAFVQNDRVEQKLEENLKAKFDLGKDRFVFPVKGPNDTVEYMPKKADATERELTKGLFVNNDDVRKMEPTEERRIRRVGSKSMSKIQLPATDEQGRRNLKTKPIPKAKDDTKLWDLNNMPEIDPAKEQELLKALKPKYDTGKRRMIYPVETMDGKTVYLPLKYQANNQEIKNGIFAEYIPPEGLLKFVQDNLEKKDVEVDGGNLRAITVDDFKAAINKEPRLILRQHNLVLETIENEPSMHQEWV